MREYNINPKYCNINSVVPNITPVERNINSIETKIKSVGYNIKSVGRNIKYKFTKIICLTFKKDKKMATRFISFEKFKNESLFLED